MSSVNTLLVGGPHDGEVREVESVHSPIWVSEVDTQDASFSSDFDAIVPIKTRVSGYFPQTLAFFKVPLQVHVHETLEGDERRLQFRLAEHLLSEKGKQVVRS